MLLLETELQISPYSPPMTHVAVEVHEILKVPEDRGRLEQALLLFVGNLVHMTPPAVVDLVSC